MFTVRLAGGHLYGKQLFTWLSLVVYFMAYFVLSFFPLDVLDGIWDLIESVSEGFLTYSCISLKVLKGRHFRVTMERGIGGGWDKRVTRPCCILFRCNKREKGEKGIAFKKCWTIFFRYFLPKSNDQ